jgi:pimeloyl-ACP methyl ester carboxylesterase
VLDTGYVESGPADGPAVMLLHGWPYDVHSFADVTPVLASAGYRVIVPFVRGYGTTRFLSDDTPRNGQQAVLAVDVIALMDAGEPRYDDLERRLASLPAIAVPTITLEGDANGAPHPDAGAYAAKFSGRYVHRVIEGGVGHNLPQEAPQAFAQAVADVDAF